MKVKEEMLLILKIAIEESLKLLQGTKQSSIVLNKLFGSLSINSVALEHSELFWKYEFQGKIGNKSKFPK